MAVVVGGSAAAVPRAAAAELIAVAAMVGPLGGIFVVVAEDGLCVVITGMPGDGALLRRLARKGARGAEPDYEDELDDEDEDPGGDEEDFVAACVGFVLVWELRCRGARGGGNWLGGLAHDIGAGARLLQSLY